MLQASLGGTNARVIAIVFAAAFLGPVAWAGPENAAARALVAEWKDGGPGMTLVAKS